MILGAVGIGAWAIGCAPPKTSQDVDSRSNAIYDLARDNFEKGNLRQALAKVDEALAIDEDNADAAYLGSVLLLDFCSKDAASSDCHFDGAERYAKEALHSNPNMRDARNTLGVIYIHEKRFDDAINVLKPLAEDIIYGSPEKSWGNLGWAYLEKGKADLAVDALRRAVAAQPNFCVGNYRLGVAYRKLGDEKAAEAALTRAVETHRPGCDRIQDAFDARAEIALRSGRREEARMDLKKCRDISAASPLGQKCSLAMRELE